MPESPPTRPGAVGPPARAGGALEEYQTIAETVGGPSLRARDNLIQGAVVLVCTGAGAAVGYLANGVLGLAIGAAAAMVGSTLVSGLVLMVLGWRRALRSRRASRGSERK